MRKLLLAILFFLYGNLFAQQNDSTLIRADKEFAWLSYQKGLAVAFDNYLADDAVFLSLTPLPIEGKSNISRLLANTKATVIWQPTGSFKDKSGTSGYTYGLSKWIYTSADSLACSYYVYHTNWINDSSGKWKVTTDIGTEISLKGAALIEKSRFRSSVKTIADVTKKYRSKNCTVINFSFVSSRKGNVPAILVKPIKADASAVVCYQHGIGTEYNKEYFLEEAKILAENGIASLLIDAPFKRVGEGFIEAGGMKDAEILENNCADWLQALTLLPTFGITVDKLFFIGQSYGARVGALMPYLDSRFRKVIVVSGIYNYAEWMHTTVAAQITELRKTIPAGDLKRYVVSLAPYDASIYLNKKNDLEIYFQAGMEDETLSRYDILSCYEMTNSRKKIQWYDSSHNLNKQATIDRIEQIIKWTNEKIDR